MLVGDLLIREAFRLSILPKVRRLCGARTFDGFVKLELLLCEFQQFL
tara:strand:+ start:266 stop:406 length:141 start_codon:yes stop_codon:yes gene_type:complete